MQKNSSHNTRKLLTVLIALLLVAAVAVGFGVSAKYRQEKSVSGKLTISSGSDGDKNSKITDGSSDEAGEDAFVYVRASVSAVWTAEDGSEFTETPEEGVDYAFNADAGWFKASDGFYYYNAPAVNESEVPDLAGLFTENAENTPEGCRFVVTVATETLSAAELTEDGVPAVTSQWGLTLNADGTVAGE